MSEQVGSAYFDLTLQKKDFDKGLNEASKSIQDFGGKISDLGKNLTTSLTLPIAGIGAASFKMAADFQDAMGATEQIFKGEAENMKKWADGLPTYYGIAQGEALQYSNMMGSMLQNIGGLSEEMAAKQAQSLLQLAGDLTAMYGGTTADAVRALTGSLKGNNTMLDNYGMVANDAMISQEALNMKIWDGVGTMSAQIKQAATLSLIMKQSSAAQGQAAREAEGASGSMRALWTEMQNLGIEIGNILIPIFLPFLQQLKELTIQFGGLDDNTKKMIVTIALIVAAIGPLLVAIGSIIGAIGPLLPIIGAVVAALSSPIGIIAMLVAGLVALGVQFGWINELLASLKIYIDPIIQQFTIMIDQIKAQLTVSFENMQPTLAKLMESFKKLEPLLQAIGVVVGVVLLGAIQAVILVITVLGSVVAETLPVIAEIFTSVVDTIGNLIQFVVALINGDWAGAWNYLMQLATSVQKFYEGWGQLILAIIKGVVDGIMNFFTGLYDSLVGHSIVPDMVNETIAWFGKIYQGVVNALAGVYSAITQPFIDAWNKVSDVAKKIKDSLKLISPYHKSSPSLVEYVEMGTAEISGMYQNMFKNIDGLSKNTRIGMIDTVTTIPETKENNGGVIINLNPTGIFARSRSEIRDVAIDMVNLINDELRARGVTLLADGVTL